MRVALSLFEFIFISLSSGRFVVYSSIEPKMFDNDDSGGGDNNNNTDDR